ncbi:threonine dehydratase [Candidatus Phycorickettsia trachydisci]|uniref:Threonine dehydratase n=1 Tax=Candidatus Phycorickettsia trachydisci TaxID=2115978 RepID=A0A2P1P8H6_9RICK|nr:serine/threonine dehydratase [Candidatus Phycorickettsia trachydisci]AVP87563.1 threonine dehydratase [Candidatus Phycorickettsia trachydisci]
MIQDTSNLLKACENIQNRLVQTPVTICRELNEKFGHNFYFKMDCLQKTGAFKVRAVLNHLLSLQNEGHLPKEIVTYSTGNHAIALGYVCNLLGIKCRIYLSRFTSTTKIEMIQKYNPEIIFTENRKEAEIIARSDEKGYFLHPSDSDLSIAGSGTMCYEALQQLDVKPDAIFAACGGGGLLSGSFLAKKLLSPDSLLFGCEPQSANDAFLSLQDKKIFELQQTPQSIADGLITPKLSPRTFEYIKKLDGIILSTEEEIKNWTISLNRLLKNKIEPSSAITMPCAIKWLEKTPPLKKQNILLLISGGNLDHQLLLTE